jgi:rhamnosyltransferase
MSRVTPHNLTDIIVDGFISSHSKSHLLVAGHLPDTKWFKSLNERSKNMNVIFLGLIKDQFELNQLILNCKAYLHGHSLGGINSALVRVVGQNRPVICVDTPFNREVVEYPNNELQAIVFEKSSNSVSDSIRIFENNEEKFIKSSFDLGEKVRNTMSWDNIYEGYKKLYNQMLNNP